MFQVASHPTPHFSLPMERVPVQAPPSLQLPRTLARPPFAEVDRTAILAMAPELAEVPIEYIRKHLAGQASDMIAAVNLLSIPSSLPKSRLPSSLDAPLRPTSRMPSSSAFPTHLLAVSSSKSSASVPNTPTVASFAAQMANSSLCPLYPTHALVLATHCTLLPRLPASRQNGSSAALHLPVVPLTVPDASTFPHLHAFLHTKRADTLLAALLPALHAALPSAAGASGSSSRGGYAAQFSADRLVRLAHTLAGTAYAQSGSQGALQVLMSHAKIINNLWKNTCALGIFDTELWTVIDLAWEIVLGALTRTVEMQRQ